MDKNKTILLVDDDADDRQFFFEAVKQVDETISCVSAGSAQDALLYLKNEENPLPDFIFLDLRMHGLSGKQCLVEIKNDARLHPIPVIVYTTSREVEESVELKRLGAAHFMSKPTSPDEIYFMLSVVLEEKWK
ncbi:MAG TPA: response regulator [Puia sp.]|nr:response regulator [Puia sp.]